jgi:hypothetical protein
MISIGKNYIKNKNSMTQFDESKFLEENKENLEKIEKIKKEEEKSKTLFKNYEKVLKEEKEEKEEEKEEEKPKEKPKEEDDEEVIVKDLKNNTTDDLVNNKISIDAVNKIMEKEISGETFMLLTNQIMKDELELKLNDRLIILNLIQKNK